MACIFFIHQNMPGQFKNICQYVAKNKKNDVYFITRRQDSIAIDGVKKVKYDLAREPSRDGHHYIKFLDEQILYGQAVTRTLLQLKDRGINPDIIFVHSGWGEGLYVKEVFPSAKLIVFSEYYYTARESDTAFVNDGEVTIEDACRLVTKNLHLTQSMMGADLIITPTIWQKYQHPPIMWDKIFTYHEGISVPDIRNGRNLEVFLPNGWQLKKGDEVVTYVSRNLEPYRGFDILFEAIKILRSRAHDIRFVIIGGDDVSYGKRAPNGMSWREYLLTQEPEAIENVAFVGKLPYSMFLDLFNISQVHLYLTVPFVLSWSMLEAMALEACILGSRVHPVQEVISDGRNGLLCDLSPLGVADGIERALSLPQAERDRLGQFARYTVEQNYDFRTVALPTILSEIKRRFGIEVSA
ncbi:MAG: glycosyltransferase [Alphaproteobacteria bacterium]|nr:glycosyltransferase [Alphaproteobacteria bacterium]